MALTTEQKRRMREASELMLGARRDCKPLRQLPEKLRPATLEESYALSDLNALAFAPIGGWKIGAAGPDETPTYAPMPLWGGYLENGDVLGSQYSRLRGVEAEIGFLLGTDLPLREQPYTREEVVAAVASAHPVIEVLESAFEIPDDVDRLSIFGDLQLNGGFIFGPPVANWQQLRLEDERVELTVDGAVRCETGMSNTAGPDLLRLLRYLANEGQARTGGLKAGQWITTGSWTGKQFGVAGSTVRATFSHFGVVSFSFARPARD
jgi:2-keto-4-pentenoate hydratase